MSKSETFRAMRSFVMPNAWDAGSAILLAEAGFEAIGTTSAGIAFSLGKPDFEGSTITRDEMLARARQIVDAVPLPVNGDLEDGYGAEPEAVAETVRLAIAAGLAGGNIEDHDPRTNALYDEVQAVERIRAARACDDAFVINAKVDGITLLGASALHDTIRRANLLLEAGADCVFPCGATDIESVRLLVREIAGPVNVVLGWGATRFTATELLDAGVSRVSLGGSIARSMLGFVRNCARELREQGSATFAERQIPQRELNALFARSAASRASG